jgi:hypothetical protein
MAHLAGPRPRPAGPPSGVRAAGAAAMSGHHVELRLIGHPAAVNAALAALAGAVGGQR